MTGYARRTPEAAALAAGFNATTYDRPICYLSGGTGGSFSGWSGLGYVGSSGAWVRTQAMNVAAHELGHNYGLWHSNSWSCPNGSVIGPGSNAEYGNPFSVMGTGSTITSQFPAYDTNLLSWLPWTSVETAHASGTYRIYALDTPSLVPSGAQALTIPKAALPSFWLEFRQSFTANPAMMNGALLYFSPWANSDGGSQLLDTTPYSTGSETDSALVIGRTFDDAVDGIHITPIGKGGTTPESLDVVVNLGSFPGNHAPTASISPPSASIAVGAVQSLTATAADADGDALAYAWDFGDGTFSTSDSAAVTKSWSAAGDYIVHCTVSDMKGGIAGASAEIIVGSPTKRRISGMVTAGGIAIAEAYVSTSGGSARSNSDGSYTISNLAPGTYTVSAAVPDAVCAPATQSANVSSSDAAGVNFTVTANTYSVTGTVTLQAAGLPGVTIACGSQTALTNASGNFTLGGLVRGPAHLVPTLAGYTFIPAALDLSLDYAGASGANSRPTASRCRR